MSGAEGEAESQPAVGEGQLRAHTRKWWEGFPSIDEVCQALAHGRVMVCGVRGGVRRGQGAEQIICSGCAAKEEQEECDLRVLNSRDRGQELSLCDVFVVQGRGHVVRVSEGGAEDLESLRVGWQSPVAGPNGGCGRGWL